MNNIETNLNLIKSELQSLITGLAGTTLSLVAVSKTFPAQDIMLAYQAGQLAFGENYPQELESKAIELVDLNLEWHFIGNLQSNKTQIIAKYANWVHTLTKLSHAKRLNQQRPDNLPPLKVLIEVNISQEISKHGLSNYQDILELAQQIQELPKLQLCGLMGIASDSNDAQQIKQQFNLLAQHLAKLNQQGFNLTELSMGMSGDYQAAIACGATILRIGSKIFGNRTYDN